MALAQASNHLAINLYRFLSEEKGNIFFSPFSISTAMGMLFCAAEGETESELRSALGYDGTSIKKGDIPSIFEEQMSVLVKNPDSYTLACANSMLSRNDFEIKDQYKTILADSFKALLLEVDFFKKKDEATRQINEWVKQKTSDMIPELVTSLHPRATMVLLNAVFFKGSWSQKFHEKHTRKQNFFNKGLNENAVEVDMMHINGDFLYMENAKFEALQLPYVGDDVAMLIILPLSKVSLDLVESVLNPSFIQDLKNHTWKSAVEVSFPRFRLEYSKSLIRCFQRLGIERLFQSGAELGIASDSTELYVSAISHKAVLEVNEEGSEAAAATVLVTSDGTSFDSIFRVDHPFIFFIYDTKSYLILFMGRVEEL